MKPQGYWFKSSKFEIEPGEDEDINPGIYGRQLARWLKARLESKGYSVEDIIDEDWGRCLVCSRDPFMLWVGCASVANDDAAQLDVSPPSKENVVWHCFAAAEPPFWRRLFRKLDTALAVSELHSELGEILRAEPEISLAREP